MPDTLAVELSRDELHSLAVPESFETDREFTVAVTNHGRDAHVHCAVEGDLARVAAIDEPNRHVPEGDTVEFLVGVGDLDGELEGEIKIVAAYGAETARTAVTLRSPDPPSEPLRSATNGESPSDRETVGDDPITFRTLVGFAAVVLALAVAAAVTTNSGVVAAGAAVVVLGVLAGLGLVTSERWE